MDIETEISGVHQSTTSCRLTEREGSITNLKDAEDDEKQFAEWKRLLKGIHLLISLQIFSKANYVT